MWYHLSKVNKNLPFFITVTMSIGFIQGLLIDLNYLKHLITPLTFLIVYPTMISLNYKKVFEVKEKKLQIIAQLINFVLIPLIAFALGKVFFQQNPYLAVGLFLAALLPTSGMTISWTNFAKGNTEEAVKMTVIGLTLGALLTPIYLGIFFNTSLALNTQEILKQILIIVFLPMGLGAVTQKVIIKNKGDLFFKENIAPKLNSLSSVGVLGIVFIAVSLKAKHLYSTPEKIPLILIPLILLYIINYILSSYVGKHLFSKSNAIALVYGTALRNLSIALGIAMTSFGENGAEMALLLSMAFIVQIQLASMYLKITHKIFH